MRRDGPFSRLSRASKPGRPLLTITLPPRLARFLIAAGAQAASDDRMTVHPNDMRPQDHFGTSWDVPSSVGTSSTPHHINTESTGAAIAAIDPAVRMALRRHPLVLAVLLSDLIIQALDLDQALARGLDLDLDYARRLSHNLIRASDRAHNLDLIYARRLADKLARARSLARDLDNGGYLHHIPARNRAYARVLASDLARVLASDLDLAQDLVDLSGSDDLIRSLSTARDLTRTIDLSLGLDHARSLAHHIALMMGRHLGIKQVEGLATALLNGALDDFTHADLTHVELDERNLIGVRWSVSGTIWPPGTDIDRLRSRSKETPPGTGIYVIGKGPEGLDRDPETSYV